MSRLERLSVDSHWARRASGLRGNILKVLDETDSGQDVSQARLEPPNRGGIRYPAEGGSGHSRPGRFAQKEIKKPCEPCYWMLPIPPFT